MEDTKILNKKEKQNEKFENKYSDLKNKYLMKVTKMFSKKEKTKEELDDKYYMASQWTLMGAKLKKHKLARISMFILIFLYLQAMFAQFISPYGLEAYEKSYTNVSPSIVRVIDSEGNFRMPFVYGLSTERDPETFRRITVEDTAQIYPIKLFVKGYEYKFLGLFETDIHLFGTPEGGKVFLFGSDSMGRCIFSRVVLGSQISLSIPLAGIFVSFILGLFFGSISGYFGGWVDNAIQRTIEIIRAFPTLPLWMALSAAIPPSISVVKMYLLITIILSFISWTGLARVVRSQIMSMKNEDYIMAARVGGVSTFKIIITHMIPGMLSYLIVSMTLAIPVMIIGETSMSFLGLGIRAPATSWGVLLDEANKIQNIAIYPWKLIPLLFVIITVLAFNFFGDGLRDAADPYK